MINLKLKSVTKRLLVYAEQKRLTKQRAKEFLRFYLDFQTAIKKALENAKQELSRVDIALHFYPPDVNAMKARIVQLKSLLKLVNAIIKNLELIIKQKKSIFGADPFIAIIKICPVLIEMYGEK